MIASGHAMRALEASNDDFEEFSHRLSIRFGETVESEAMLLERDDELSAQSLESLHVSGDQRPPNSTVEARQRPTCAVIGEPLAIGVSQPIEDHRFSPFQ